VRGHCQAEMSGMIDIIVFIDSHDIAISFKVQALSTDTAQLISL